MIFYTRQSPQVLTELRLSGSYVVKEEYITEKYTTITDHYAPLYRMLTLFARGKVYIPDGASYPIWLSPEGTETVPPERPEAPVQESPTPFSDVNFEEL